MQQICTAVCIDFHDPNSQRAFHTSLVRVRNAFACQPELTSSLSAQYSDALRFIFRRLLANEPGDPLAEISIPLIGKKKNHKIGIGKIRLFVIEGLTVSAWSICLDTRDLWCVFLIFVIDGFIVSAWSI